MTALEDRKYCLLLGSEKSRDRSLLGAARSTEHPIALLLLNGAVNSHHFADLTIGGNPNNAPQALAAVEQFERATGRVPASVVPLTELSLEAGLAIATRYGLPYLAPETVRLARNKQLMKQAFLDAGLPAPKFAGFSSLEELEQVSRQFEFPVVVKPKNAGGSEGVRLVSSADELAGGYEYLSNALRGYRDNYALSEDAFQIEQYIDAEHEVSVEILNTGSGRHILAMTDKYLGEHPYFVELGHSVPSVFSNHREVRETALAACAALGVDRGVAHVELRIRPDGQPVLIEVNARPGGDGILDLVERVIGINPFELHCSSYVQDGFAFDRQVTTRGRAAIAFLKSEPGIVEEVSLPALDALPSGVVGLNVWIRKGDLSRECIDSNTRDGAIEFYWPDDDASAKLTEHLEVAGVLARECIRVAHTPRGDGNGGGGAILDGRFFGLSEAIG